MGFPENISPENVAFLEGYQYEQPTADIEFYPFCDPEVCDWLRNAIREKRKVISAQEKLSILNKLSRSEAFETFLHTRYVGQKRFSLEGAETLVPMLQSLLEELETIDEVIIGMPHRGRLNMLSNILQKSHHDIFLEFEDHYEKGEGMGDVKYHKGYFSEVELPNKRKIKLWLAANPSHLESVDPVVEGITRARQKEHDALPILIHGDAAVSGQGVVYETLQLARLGGYTTGGTIHIVINNHIGFTTLPIDSRSTKECTDIAKAFSAPIFHVDAEDPENCIWATRLALKLRQKFKIDVFIDLNCYRKYGHNEGDEPSFTQPKLYESIRQKPTIRTLYHDALLQEGVVTKEQIAQADEEFRNEMQKAFTEVRQNVSEKKEVQPKVIDQVATKVEIEKLVELSKALLTPPEGFSLHPRIQKPLADRLLKVEEQKDEAIIDWSFAESLAFATLLQDGFDVRLAGQDTRRGTFSQRHGMWVDQVNETKYYPHEAVSIRKGQFELIDSPLSEFAALGFEYGYSLGSPQTFVLWEAQFGDFVNGAQVIIDQYIAAGEQKWQSKSRLCLLLPHGYEGQGPEHSSARMERFLSLAANNNMFVVNPTTPAQLFHLLRREMKIARAMPLIVFTPKGLLRHPECISRLKEFATCEFQEILDDDASREATRLIFCQGRIYYELKPQKRADSAIIRIEQLYPFAKEKFENLVASYPRAEKFYWVQEEPANMGAWSTIRDEITPCLPRNALLEYRGRLRASSPAVGSHRLHEEEQKKIIGDLWQ